MRASVPHDVDLEDHLVYGLTPIRFGYLVVAVLGSMGLWGIRWLPLPLVFWAFLNMLLNPGGPCREAQRSIQAWWMRLGRNWRNPCTSAFCCTRVCWMCWRR